MFGIYYMLSGIFLHNKKRRLSRASLFLYYIPFFVLPRFDLVWLQVLLDWLFLPFKIFLDFQNQLHLF